ncbi:hypothetical protein ACFX13_019620 [Malus domestica]
MSSIEAPMDEELMDYLSVNFEDSLKLEERNVETVYLVGMLIADVEPSQNIVKEVLRSVWRKMGNVMVLKAKPNIYSIQVGDEKSASRILEGNPWFIKGALFTVKAWPLYQSLDEISANRVEIDATKPLLTSFIVPCPSTRSQTLRLWYEDLKDFCYNCERLSHIRNCKWKSLISRDGENRYNPGLRTASISKLPTNLFLDRELPQPSNATNGVRGRTSERRGTIPPVTTENVATNSEMQGMSEEMLAPPTHRRASLQHWDNMDNPNSVGTHYHNESLTITINGLSLDKKWFDPRKVPPWALMGNSNLIDNPFEQGDPNSDSSTTDGVVPSKRKVREATSPSHFEITHFVGRLSHSTIINHRSKRGSIGGGWQVPAPPKLMKILAWNCWGLGNPLKVQDLLGVIKQKVLTMVFLSETKCDVKKLRSAQLR